MSEVQFNEVVLKLTSDEKVDTSDEFSRAARVKPGSNHITTVACVAMITITRNVALGFFEIGFL